MRPVGELFSIFYETGKSCARAAQRLLPFVAVLVYLFTVEDGGAGTQATAHTENNLQEFVLFFHHVGPGNRTRAVRLSNECLYPLSHPPGPWSWLPSVSVLGQHIYTSMSVNIRYLQRAAEETDSPGRLRGGELGDWVQRDDYPTLYT